MKTLLVEDDEMFLKVLTGMLSEFGEIDTCVNGVLGYEAFESNLSKQDRYDLVCLDIHMAEMDGQTLLRKLRKLEADRGIAPHEGVKVIMVTGNEEPDEILYSFREQCDAYLVKPLQMKKLKSQLEELELV